MNAIELEISDNIISEMVLCHDEKWLVCAHAEGMVTIVNTEDMSYNTITPFAEEQGHIDSIWGVRKIEVEFIAMFEKLVFHTSNGLYIAMLTNEGEMQATDDVFFKDNNVTNTAIIKDDLILCTVNDAEGISKLMTVDVDEETTELIIDQKESVYAYDLEKVPGTGDDAYFIMHTGKGLSLIDPANKKSYDLRFDDNTNYNMC